MGTTIMTMSNILANNVRTYIEIQRAFDECDPEIQEVIKEMILICEDHTATDDEKERAMNTVVEGLFPVVTADFMQSENRLRHSSEALSVNATFEKEEAAFAEKLRAIMHEKGLSQDTLAEKAGVSQSAISNMLSRACRPQRRTIKKFAQALNVPPESLWPGFSDDETS